MKIRLLFICIIGLLATAIQASIPVGTWRTHLSYDISNYVVLTPNKAFALADHHLYSVDKEDGSIDTYTKLDGLSENEVEIMAYDLQTSSLILVYTNSNIDIINEAGDIFNIPDVYQKNWNVDKSSYQIYCENHHAYIAMGFGIVVLDLKKMEVADTYIIGPNATKVPIFGFTADEQFFYALTEKNILRAPKTGKNLLDYANWQENPISLPLSSQCKTLFYVGNSLLTVDNQETVLQYQGAWSELLKGDKGYVSVAITGEHVLISGGSAEVDRYNLRLEKQQHYYKYSAYSAYDAQRDQLWHIMNERGVASYQPVGEQSNFYKPASLAASSIHDIIYDQNAIWVAPGGYWIERFSNPLQLSSFKDEVWKSHQHLFSQISSFTEWSMDLTSVAVDPRDPNHFYFATTGEGVFEVKNNKVVQLYNDLNTSGVLTTIVPNDHHYVRLDALKYDKDANLWMLNCMSGVKVLDASGKWIALNYPPLQNCPNMRKLQITKKQKWFICERYTPCVFVFEDNGTLEDMSDDHYRMFRSGDFYDKDGKVIGPTNFFDVAIDLDGTAWVGTDWGPILFTQTKHVFDDNYRCTRVKIPREDGSGLADYLLDGEVVRCIAVDGGNRKWVGTQGSGAYLLSPDGKQTLLHFTTENSPLATNNIIDIAIIPSTGEVFFGTDKGLYSYRSDATRPEKEASQSTIKVFPNPVRPDYSGMITISGLEENSHVWITDAAGGVVFQGRSNGGTCSWDGRNYGGKLVSGGIYFVLVSNANADDHRSVASKLLIVR